MNVPRRNAQRLTRLSVTVGRTNSSDTNARVAATTFFAEGKALYKQFPTNQVGSALDAYYSGLSYKQTAEHMEDAFDIPEPSKAAVHAWVKSYTQLALAYIAG